MYPSVVLGVVVLSYGCRACEITGLPKDTVAKLGETATLTCTTNFTICQDLCAIRWERETNNGFKKLSASACATLNSGVPDRYSVSSGPDWSLTIAGVQPSDARQYRCLLYKYTKWVYSSPATLIVPSLTDISIQPPGRSITTGDDATFKCTVQSQRGALPTLNVKWFVNETNIRTFQDQPLYQLDNSGYTLTFLKISVNHTNVHCKAFSGTKSVKRSDNYLILIHPQKKPITSAAQVPETEESHQPNPSSTNSLSIVSFHSTTPTERNIQSVTVEGAHQSPSIQPSTPNPDPKLQDTSLVDNTTFIIVGGVITAVLLMLLISFIIYCLVFKRKHKATHSTRYASSPQDDDGERVGDGISEIQLHRVNSRCDQENDHTSSAGERSVDSPIDIVTVVVTPDLHQQAKTRHDQDNVDKPLSTESDGSVKDGEKGTDKQNHPESMYAMVDKSRAKSKTLDAVSTEEASWKVSGDGKDGSMLNRGTDAIQTLVSYSKHESPSEHYTSTVAVKDSPVPGHVVDRQPPVIPYHLSKRQASTATTQAQAGLEQTAESVENGLVKDNPIQGNVEGLVYADLDLSRGSARIINPEEETVYAEMETRVL